MPTRATTRMNPEDVVLGDVSPTQKDKSCVIPHQELPGVVTFLETASRTVGARGWGGTGVCVSWGRSFSLGGWRESWRRMVGTAELHTENG